MEATGPDYPTAPSEFLEARRQAALRLPPEERTPEVAAFIETCELQSEAAALLDARPPRSWRARAQRETLVALYMTRSHLVSPTSPLWYAPAAQEAMSNADAAAAAAPATAGLGAQVVALLERQGRSAAALLKAAAGLGALGPQTVESCGLLELTRRVVARLRNPEAQRVLGELLAALQAGLPRPLLSAPQLLAFFVDQGRIRAYETLALTAGVVSPDGVAHAQDMAELLPALMGPDDPKIAFWMTLSARFPMQGDYLAREHRALRRALEVAQAKKSDFFTCMAVYQIAIMAPELAAAGPPAVSGLHETPPSEVVRWLAAARVAHRRCSAVLPKQ
eukprot:scaffold6.g2622.t1